MRIIQKRQKGYVNGISRETNGECAICLKNLVRIFVEKIYKMVFLEGSGVPVLYIGHTVPKG
jgi:hypothetical protein